MSFASVAALPQCGRAIRVDASSDDFATVTYRWADRVIDDGTNVWDARVLSLGDIQRSLGEARLATSASASLELDNTDGALDALVTGTSFGALRFRIYLVVFVEVAQPSTPTLETRLLGEFTMATPARDADGRLSLSLGDDMMTRIGAGLMLPTFRDWFAVGTASNNPLIPSTADELENVVGLPDVLSFDTPIQLAFGEDWLQALPHILCPFNDNYSAEVIVPLYSTVDLSAVSQSLVDRLRIEWREIFQHTSGSPTTWRDIPRDYVRPSTNPQFPNGANWLVEKSPTITKGGRDFQIVYLRVKTHLGIGWPVSAPVPGQSGADHSNASLEAYDDFQDLGGYQSRFVQAMDPGDSVWVKFYRTDACRVLRWFVMAAPKSQITNAPALGAPSHAVDVATDLVTEYLSGSVDATTAARVKGGNPNAACSGVVHPWTERQNYEPVPGTPNTLRQVMTKLAQSSDIDFFINWSGQLAFASDVWAWLAVGGSAAISALATYDETDVSGLARWLPSEGERWAPFNRIYLEGGKPYPPENLEVPFQGAFDIASTQLDDLVPQETRILETTLQQGWRPYRQQKDTPLNYRQADGSARWRISFKTHILFLQHDLGDYFRLTWRRDSSSPALYEGTVFQIEALTYSAATNEVTVEAIWRDDARTTRQYILDDENNFLIEMPDPPTDADVFDLGGDCWVTTSGGFLLTVSVGDLFEIRYDPANPDPSWNVGVWVIADVDGGDVRLLQHPDGTRPAPSLPQTIPAADWRVIHSPLTISDLTNYPNGVRVYGCVTDIDGTLSDDSLGNKILTG